MMMPGIWFEEDAEDFLFENEVPVANIYRLLTKCEVKMAGYWSSSFLRVYGPRRS